MKLSFSPADLATIAEHASKLAKIIRDWLPFDGESDAKVHNWKTADSWFSLAADHYAQCERIRNPGGLPFIERGGFYNGPQDAGPFWFEICYALDEIAIVYRWRGLSDGSGTSCSFAWRETIPEIPSGVLKRLERAAAGLQNVAGVYLADEQPAGKPATTKPAAAIVIKATPKPAKLQGISLRSAAEVLAQRGEDHTEEILTKLRKFSHKFEKTGFALKPTNKPLYSIQAMAGLIVKCGYADSEKSASQNLKSRLEDCRDS